MKRFFIIFMALWIAGGMVIQNSNRFKIIANGLPKIDRQTKEEPSFLFPKKSDNSTGASFIKKPPIKPRPILTCCV